MKSKTSRPSLGVTLANVGNLIQNSAARLGAGAAQLWMEAHREELLQTIEQAKVERGASLLHEFCRQVPLAAGIVSVAMNGSPDMAIAAIGFYNPELADRLRPHRENVQLLQECWRRGEQQQS